MGWGANAGDAGERGSRDGKGRTLVELVYDPPLGSNYSVRMEEGEGDGGANAYLGRDGYLNIGGVGTEAVPGR
jgi:hypothetical protein